MNDRARREAVIWYFPEFLDADRVDLGITFAVELQAIGHLLCKRTANSLAKHRDSCGNIDPGLEIGLRFARFIDALIACPHAYYCIPIVEHLSAWEFRKDIDSNFLALLTEPAHYLV